MLQRIKEYFRRTKQEILSQEVKGRYVKTSYRRNANVILGLSVVNIGFGVLFTFLYSRLFETSLAYNSTGSYYVYLPKGDINFYIQLEDFYQSHLRHSRSISYKQLEGKRDVDSKKTQPLDYQDDIPIYPAGLLSNTYFQDGFEIQGLEISTSNINWTSAINNLAESGYKRGEVVPPPLWNKYKKIPELYRDNRYINWIYNAPFYSFRKLWGRIQVPASKIYLLKIDSAFPYGKKSVVFAQTSWIGNKNYFLSTSMIVVGIIGIGVGLML